MSWIIRWLWKRYGGATALEGGRAFWFGDGRPRAAGWIQWHWCRRAFLVSWATFILMVWWFLVAAWTKGLEKEGLTVGVYATMTALMMGNFVPACLALWDERKRQRLRREPTALMFVVFVGSLFVSMTLSGLLGASWNGVVNGLIIGLSIFVLSCGMLFPLGLAPAAAVWTWATVRREGEVSARYAWGMGALCGAGWLIAIVVGMIGGGGVKDPVPEVGSGPRPTPVPPEELHVHDVGRFRSACPDRMHPDLNAMIEGCQDFYHAVDGKALEVGIADAGDVGRINACDRGGLAF